MNCLLSTYRSGVGKLLYLTKLSRPELASAVRELSKFVDYSTNDHFYAMHRAMRYVIDTKHHVLTLIPDNEFKNVIMGFSDSNYATDKNGRLYCSRQTLIILALQTPIQDDSTWLDIAAFRLLTCRW